MTEEGPAARESRGLVQRFKETLAGLNAKLSFPLERPPVGADRPPIDPGHPEVDPETELAKLKPAGENSKTAKLLEKRDFMGVIHLLSKSALTAGESNDLGCAWAWRAQRKGGGFAYWSRAIGALRTAGMDEKTKEIADANLAIVYRVSGLT